MRTEAYPQSCAADCFADSRQKRGKHQKQTRNHAHIRKSSHNPVIAHECKQQSGQDKTEDKPDNLRFARIGGIFEACAAVVDSDNHRGSDKRKQGNARKTGRVCVRMAKTCGRPDCENNRAQNCEQNRVIVRYLPQRSVENLEKSQKSRRCRKYEQEEFFYALLSYFAGSQCIHRPPPAIADSLRFAPAALELEGCELDD